MREVRRLLLVVVGLVLGAGASGASSRALAQTVDTGAWVEIGRLPDTTPAAYPAPISGGGTGLVAIPAKRDERPAVMSLALGAKWPEDGLLFALQQTGWIQRTRDAGVTWESVAGPTLAGGGGGWQQQLVLADAPNGTRVLFFINNDTRLPLYRSTDDGDTWQEVLRKPDELSDRGRFSLVLSPDFARDGLAFGLLGWNDDWVGNSMLLRSSDAGASWAILDPAPGRVPHDLVFSPTFAQDRTVWLHTLTAFRPYWDPERAQALPKTPVLQVSTDDGDSWEPLSDPLIDAGLLRIQASPNFFEDGLLIGIMPRPMQGNPLRSRDRGVSWETIAGLPNYTGSFGLSPNFAQDGVGLALAPKQEGHSSTCELFHTTDGGLSWTQVGQNFTQTERWNGCAGPTLLGAQGRYWGFVSASIGHTNYWSTDGGQSWQQLPIPGGKGLQQMVPIPRFSDEPMLIAISTDARVWSMRL